MKTLVRVWRVKCRALVAICERNTKQNDRKVTKECQRKRAEEAEERGRERRGKNSAHNENMEKRRAQIIE